MPVKIIPQEHQQAYCSAFYMGAMSINEIVEDSNASRRTVIRMLEDHGIDPEIKRRKKPAQEQEWPDYTSNSLTDDYVDSSWFKKLTLWIKGLFPRKVVT